MGLFALFAAVGAAIAFLFDPTSGRRRRALARDRAGALVRRARRRADRLQRHAEAVAYGVSQRIQHGFEEPGPTSDDATLAQKVQSEIFRHSEVSKGKININAENGTVVLRGEVESPDLIRDLEERARKVQGVEEVENLLHLPGVIAPMHGKRGS